MSIEIFLLIFFGFLICFSGYDLYKHLIGVAGALVVGAFFYSFVFNGTHQDWLAIVTFLIGLPVGYALAQALYPLAVFLSGAFVGYCCVFYNASGHPDGTAVIIAAIIAGALAVAFEKFVMVVATGFYGSLAVVTGFALWFGSTKMEGAVDLSKFNAAAEITYHQGTYLFFWVILGIVGSVCQYNQEDKSKKTSTLRERLDLEDPG